MVLCLASKTMLQGSGQEVQFETAFILWNRVRVEGEVVKDNPNPDPKRGER